METSSWEKDKNPYFVFKCNKCAQYIYVKATQKTRKCLRCGFNHRVKKVVEKKLGNDLVYGLAEAVNRVKVLQNTLALEKDGSPPDLRTGNDFHVIIKEVNPTIAPENESKNNDYSINFGQLLKKLSRSYSEVPFYMIKLMAKDYGISELELRLAIKESEKQGMITKLNDNYYRINSNKNKD